MMGYSVGLSLVLLGMLWSGCNNSKTKVQETVEALPELPAADVANLKAVPNTKTLATSVLKRSPRPVPAKIQPACAIDDVTFTYSVEVEYPVTVCIPLNIPSTGTATGVYTGGLTPTHKLDNSKLPQDLQSLATGSQNSASSQPPTIWQCRQDKGPWQGSLTSEKGCTDNCATDNILTLLNTPNLVKIEWYGTIFDDKPPDVTFVGGLHQIDVERDRCHPQNVAPPTK